MKTTKNIGILVPAPAKICVDAKCPFHGALKVRGRTFTGIVISDKMQNTVIVEWPTKRFNKKYERFQVFRSKVKAHNPKCIDAKMDDHVTIMETRPLSKTKNFVVVKIEKKEEPAKK